MTHFIFRNSWWAIRKRPKIGIGVTVFDFVVGIVGLVAVLAIWVILIVNYSGLPDVIPIHYNASGHANRFGEKSEILALPVIATILYVGMNILSMFPRVFNYPVKITENNAFLQYRNAARMVRCLAVSIVFVFGCGFLLTIRNATGDAEGPGIWFMPFSLAIIFIPVIYFMVKSFMYR